MSIFNQRAVCFVCLLQALFPITIATITVMDRASQVLMQTLHTDGARSYRALAERSNVPHSTLHHRDRGRESKEAKAQRQQYLTPEEEKAVVKFLLLISNLGQPVRLKFLSSLAFCVARRRSTTNKPIKPPGKNWPRGFEKRHPEFKVRRVRAIDWKRHDNHIYDKIREWFKVIRKLLQDPAIRPENVYNMDETGVMLSMLGSVKVLVGKDDLRDYKGAGVKRTMVITVKYIKCRR